MRPTASLLAIACAAATVSCGVPAPRPYVGGPRIVRCSSTAGSAGTVTISDSTVPTIVSDGAGDELAIPSGATAAGTKVKLKRSGGAADRRVKVEASRPVAGAVLTLNLAGCDSAAAYTVALVPPSGPPVDAGGTVSGSRVTSRPLPHLSIYAVATN